MNKIEALNDIVTGLGGTGGYKYEIQALNAWAVLVGAAGGYKYEIQALNAIDKAKGGTGLHKYNIDALNSICKAAGGSGLNKYEIAALAFIGALSNQNEPEVTAYIAGLTTPLSSGQIEKLNTFVAAIKTGLGISALSDAFDVFRIYAGETAESSLKNLVKDANHATAVNSPTFTQYEGFTGNGTSSYIEENWNGRTADAVRYSLNSASYGMCIRILDRLGTNKFAGGVYSTTDDGGAENALRISHFNSSTLYLAINNSVQSDSITNQDYYKGIIILSRISNTTINQYIDKNKTVRDVASTNIPNQGLISLARRTGDGTVGFYSISQVSAMFLGKALSDAEANIVTDAIEAYMDSNGKGVIA